MVFVRYVISQHLKIHLRNNVFFVLILYLDVSNAEILLSALLVLRTIL